MNQPKTSNRSPIPPTVKIGELQNNLSYLSRLVRVITMQSGSEYFEKFDFASGQKTMLYLISINKDITQNELANALVMKKSQVTNLIADLVERKLVIRESHEGDRRFNTLRLTAEGNRVCKKLEAQMSIHGAHLGSPLSAQELIQLTTLLSKLLKTHLSDSGIDFR
jgi:DNA-binding MarR family transcriptional regulator